MFVRFLDTEWSVVSTRRNNYRIFSNRSRQSIYILRTILFEIFFFLNRNFQVDGSTLRNTVYFYSVITIEYDQGITASYPDALRVAHSVYVLKGLLVEQKKALLRKVASSSPVCPNSSMKRSNARGRFGWEGERETERKMEERKRGEVSRGVRSYP